MSQEINIQEVSSNEPVINSDVFQVSTQVTFSDMVTMFRNRNCNRNLKTSKALLKS